MKITETCSCGASTVVSAFMDQNAKGWSREALRRCVAHPLTQRSEAHAPDDRGAP